MSGSVFCDPEGWCWLPTHCPPQRTAAVTGLMREVRRWWSVIKLLLHLLKADVFNWNAVDTFILHLASLGLVKTTVADTQKFPSEKACVFPKTNFKMKVGQNSNVTHPEVHCPVFAPLCFEPQSWKTLGVCFGAWCRRHFFFFNSL